ncbi:MAG: type I methionyl aminopeptidase [Chloroflexi bacterium]|nr:type I methionyl aminopeptidase [Chloroflexota bacterium]MYE33134.1 type I methionyl aminopeptidase [Chloroflexota bacterium]
MREAGRRNAEVRSILLDAIAPGVTGRELDELAKAEIAKRDGTPTFMGYAPGGRPPYPGAICYSVNAQLVHGLPGDLALAEGDIVSVDLGVTYGGYVSDAAFTAAVGEVPPEVAELLRLTQASLLAGIEQARAGKYLGDISHAIGAVGEQAGYGIIREYGGHGVGREMHEPPHVANFGRPGVGHRLRAGMVLALEPMFALGGERTVEEEDRWTVSMLDGSLCAHFEETVAITDGAPEVLTSIAQLSSRAEATA